MGLWICPNGIDQLFDLEKLYPCYTPNPETKLITSKCKLFLFSAVLSSDPATFPDNAGLVFGPRSYTVYFTRNSFD